MRAKKILIGLIATVLTAQAFPQSIFYGSGILRYFNRGEYQTTADSIQAWMGRTSTDQDLGYYYIGESYYNLGLSGRGRPAFEQALSAFNECLLRIPARDGNPNLYDNAMVKKAWTLFRLSEMGAPAAGDLEKIPPLFRNGSASTDDSLRLASVYMAGETGLRLAAESRIRMCMLDQSAMGQKALDALDEARSAFVASAAAKGPSQLRVASLIRLQDLDLERAVLYAGMSESVFKNIHDPAKKASADQTAMDLFSGIHPAVLADSLPWQAGPVLAYTGMISSLHRYLHSGNPADKQSLNKALEQPDLKSFASDLTLARGLRDSRDMTDNAALRDNESFTRAADAIISQSIQPVSGGIPEALYWAGRLQAATKIPAAGETFRKFLAVTAPSADEPRMQALREDAAMQLLSMRLETAAASGGTAALKSLKSDLENLRPETVLIRDKRDELLQLTGVLLDPQKVWQNLSGSPDARLNDIFKIIGNLFVRSNQVVGQERRTLLNKIQSLFEFTRSRRAEETRYYQGLYRFLDAEIQVKDKARKYREAADWMKDSKGDFLLEGRYLRARSLLAADDYANSRVILADLINSAKSTRSAYFLGEIFRMERNYAAARRCYDAVMRKTEGREGGELWFNAASAANKTVAAIRETSGDNPAALSGIRLDDIQFPEKWMRGEEIAMEQFVESVFPKIQALREGMALFTAYGIPRRSVYPSVVTTPGLRSPVNGFGNFTAGIAEKTGAVTSTLLFTLVFPEGASKNASMRLNGQPVDLDPEGSFRRTFTLGDTAQIRIQSDGYYPVADRILFTQPRQTRMVIPLVPVLSFHKIETGGPEFIRFPNRLDGNAVFFEGGEAAIGATALYRAFQSDVLYRDFAYSKMHQGVIVAQARPGRLLFYGSDANLSTAQEFKVSFPDTSNRLISPEGVAVDSRGNVYAVDWAQHKILVFRPDGFFLRSFGGFGENAAGDVGTPARFDYPCRIAIAEDPEGVTLAGDHFYRPLELFVSDRNGIHFIDDQGNYLSTVLYSAAEKGTFSALSVEGYGAACKLSVYNRRTGEVQRFGGEYQTVK
jgi:hypothetical protein